jgi:hypothetical protein
LKIRDSSNSRVNWNHLKNIQKIPEEVPDEHDKEDLFTAAILGTAHILGKVSSNVKVENI